MSTLSTILVFICFSIYFFVVNLYFRSIFLWSEFKWSFKKVHLIVPFVCSFLDDCAVSNRQLRPRFPSGEGGLIKPLC